MFYNSKFCGKYSLCKLAMALPLGKLMLLIGFGLSVPQDFYRLDRNSQQIIVSNAITKGNERLPMMEQKFVKFNTDTLQKNKEKMKEAFDMIKNRAVAPDMTFDDCDNLVIKGVCDFLESEHKLHINLSEFFPTFVNYLTSITQYWQVLFSTKKEWTSQYYVNGAAQSINGTTQNINGSPSPPATGVNGAQQLAAALAKVKEIQRSIGKNIQEITAKIKEMGKMIQSEIDSDEIRIKIEKLRDVFVSNLIKRRSDDASVDKILGKIVEFKELIGNQLRRETRLFEKCEGRLRELEKMGQSNTDDSVVYNLLKDRSVFIDDTPAPSGSKKRLGYNRFFSDKDWGTIFVVIGTRNRDYAAVKDTSDEIGTAHLYFPLKYHLLDLIEKNPKFEKEVRNRKSADRARDEARRGELTRKEGSIYRERSMSMWASVIFVFFLIW